MTRAANWKRLVIERGYGVRWVTALLAVLTVVQVAPAQVSDLDVAVFRTRRGADLTVVVGADCWPVMRVRPRPRSAE